MFGGFFWVLILCGCCGVVVPLPVAMLRAVVGGVFGGFLCVFGLLFWCLVVVVLCVDLRLGFGFAWALCGLVWWLFVLAVGRFGVVCVHFLGFLICCSCVVGIFGWDFGLAGGYLCLSACIWLFVVGLGGGLDFG